MRNNSPCKDCEDRNAECHAKCEKYLSWQQEHIEEIKKIKKAKRSEGDAREYTIHSIARFKNKKIKQM